MMNFKRRSTNAIYYIFEYLRKIMDHHYGYFISPERRRRRRGKKRSRKEYVWPERGASRSFTNYNKQICWKTKRFQPLNWTADERKGTVFFSITKRLVYLWRKESLSNIFLGVSFSLFPYIIYKSSENYPLSNNWNGEKGEHGIVIHLMHIAFQ